MKILFFASTLGRGGLERQLVELIKGLQKFPDIESELVLTDKQIHYNEIYKTNIRIHFIERRKIKKDIRLFFEFYKIVRKYRPNVINVWDDMTAIYSIPTKILLRIPVVNCEIRSAPTFITKGIKRHKINKLFSDMIVANSYAGLISYKESVEKCKVIYNGFDLKRIENLQLKSVIRDRFNLRTKFVVVMVARFSKAKDYNTYIQAATIVLNKNMDVSFLCIGSGDDSCMKLSVSNNHKNNILFLGQQNDIESIVNICDICVLSTYTEGISNSILEYMALSKPVIATEGGGTKELVIDNKTGYLVPQKSPEVIAEKINYLLEKPYISKQLGENGYKNIVENFNFDKMVKEYYNIFDGFARKSGIK